MIKNMKIRVNVDGRGNISSGKKSEEGYPQSLDYFNIDDFPELKDAYGDKPAKLFLYFPSDRIEDFFDCNFVAWGKKTGDAVKKRQCDGEECIHRIKEGNYEAGEISPCICKDLDDKDPNKCKYSCYFKAFVANPKTGKVENAACYLFQTHSENSGDAIFSTLANALYNKALGIGFIRSIPFELSVKMVSGKMDAKQKFPIWKLDFIGTIPQLIEKKCDLLQLIHGNAVLPAPETKQIEAPKPTPATPKPKLSDAQFIAMRFEEIAKQTILPKEQYKAARHSFETILCKRGISASTDLTEEEAKKVKTVIADQARVLKFIELFIKETSDKPADI